MQVFRVKFDRSCNAFLDLTPEMKALAKKRLGHLRILKYKLCETTEIFLLIYFSTGKIWKLCPFVWVSQFCRSYGLSVKLKNDGWIHLFVSFCLLFVFMLLCVFCVCMHMIFSCCFCWWMWMMMLRDPFNWIRPGRLQVSLCFILFRYGSFTDPVC